LLIRWTNNSHLTEQHEVGGWSIGTNEMPIGALQQAKRFLRILFGFTLLALGVIMTVTPGPGWLTIFLALGILAAEFVWARRLLDRLKKQGIRLRDAFIDRPPADRV
jgi:uncharacterized protein (TIGR02611 family)